MVLFFNSLYIAILDLQRNNDRVLDEQSLYQGLDTQELKDLSQVSHELESPLDLRREEPLRTEDECAICCTTLKDSDVFQIPAQCQHRYHE